MAARASVVRMDFRGAVVTGHGRHGFYEDIVRDFGLPGNLESETVDAELAAALDDLILGRGVARGRHSMRHRDRLVRAELEERLLANGFQPMTVLEAPIEAGEKIPAFYLHDETTDFGYIRWEIFTPRSRRKLFASEYRRPDNQEWAVQLP